MLPPRFTSRMAPARCQSLFRHVQSSPRQPTIAKTAAATRRCPASTTISTTAAAVPHSSFDLPPYLVRSPPPASLPESSLWFDPSPPFGRPANPGPSPPPIPPDQDYKVKIGKTVRILHDRLPTLLQKPLPMDILAPNITLHLFPSSHPHLPVVSGKPAYVAALWTSPIAWKRIPLISEVKIEILSEHMTKEPSSLAPNRQGCMPDQLVVRWKTIGSGKNWNIPWMGTAIPEKKKTDKKMEFTGLFIFEFDRQGRILSHTIENLQDGGENEKVSKVVGLTDWILGGMKGQDSPAMCEKLPDNHWRTK